MAEADPDWGFYDWNPLDPSWAQRLGVDLTKTKVDTDPDWKGIADELASALADLQSYWGVPDYFLADEDAKDADEAAKKALEHYKEASGHGVW